MGNRKVEEKISTQLAGKQYSDFRRPKYGETANSTSNTVQTSHHTGGRDRSVEIVVRDLDEPEQRTSGTRFRSQAHQGRRHAAENDKPGNEGQHPLNRRTWEETGQVHPDISPYPEYKVRNNRCSFSDTRFLLSVNIQLHGCEMNQQGRIKDPGSDIHIHADPTNGDNCAVLQSHVHTTLRTTSSTMLQMPSLEPHIKVCMSRTRRYHCGKQGQRMPQLTTFAAKSQSSQNV